MRLYLLRGDLDFHWLRPVDEEIWHCRGGVPVDFAWKEPSLALSADESDPEPIAVDCFAMNTGCDGLILSGYARDVLGELLSSAGEFWPVKHMAQQYWWFNCLASVDALDAAASDAEWDSVDGDWGRFRWITMPRRLVFRPASVKSAPAVFRIPEFPQGVLFCDDSVERAIARYSLTGFRLDLVWSSTDGGVQDPPGFGFEGVFEEPVPGELARKRALVREILRERGTQVAGRR